MAEEWRNKTQDHSESYVCEIDCIFQGIRNYLQFSVYDHILNVVSGDNLVSALYIDWNSLWKSEETESVYVFISRIFYYFSII